MVSSFKGNVIFFWQAGTVWANHRDLVEAGFQVLLRLVCFEFAFISGAYFYSSGVQKPEVFTSLLSMLLCLEFHLLSLYHSKSTNGLCSALQTPSVALSLVFAVLSVLRWCVSFHLDENCLQKFWFFFALLSFQTLAS